MTTIGASKPPWTHLKDILDYRDLLWFLVWRDVSVRYKQTLLGGAWAVLQPLLTMVVFTIFFGRLGGLPSDELPMPVFYFSGLVLWTYFSAALTGASNSLIANQNLVTKVYFPRLVIPLGTVLAPLVDLAIALVALVLMMASYSIWPTTRAMWLPVFIAVSLATALASGFWFSALNVRYRDIRHVLPFVIQFWMFASPLAYPASIVPDRWRLLYGVNPMAGAIEGFRWALLGRGTPPGGMLLVSSLVVALLLFGGWLYFRKAEETFADVI